jgi:hypothetical protein
MSGVLTSPSDTFREHPTRMSESRKKRMGRTIGPDEV